MIDSKWVYKTKRSPTGEIERHKAWLVAKGFMQVEGIDYTKTFTPMTKFSTIRILLALAAQLDLEIHQMDVKSAFLNGEIEEEIYVEIPPGLNKRLTFKGNGEITMHGFVDADWASNSHDQRSITRQVFLMGGGTVSWQSKKQDSVALSSTEAEYMAVSSATREALCISTFLNELTIIPNQSIPLLIDNQSAISLAKNAVFHSLTKHIAIRYHFIHKRVESGEIKLEYIPTNLQVANVLMKPLGREKHEQFIEGMGLSSC